MQMRNLVVIRLNRNAMHRLRLRTALYVRYGTIGAVRVWYMVLTPGGPVQDPQDPPRLFALAKK